ncbi:MAG: chromate resistance protein ChrB domain-containing protein [Pseudomonadota bacterium]
MPSPTQITPAQLNRLIGTPDAPDIVDVCIEADFAADPRLIPSARRQPFAEIEALIPRLSGKRVVIVCQKGRKLSQGAAAVLRCGGIAAETLEGGIMAWRDAGLPLIPAASLPPRDAMGRTLWVTRHRPKIDRIACPWLIRRFVDPSARFLFVAPDEVHDVANRFTATPFDVANVHWTYRGDGCTFDTMIEEFALTTVPLRRLATIIRAADTARPDLAAEAPGLLALSLGLSRMYRNDLAQLDAGMLFFDALYRWCRDAVAETHEAMPEAAA